MITPSPGNYFQSLDEANDWLCFDDPSEQIAYAYPDRYGEWQQWQALDAGKDMFARYLNVSYEKGEELWIELDDHTKEAWIINAAEDVRALNAWS